ncbi:MAG: hypothetical protein ABW069_07825 [Duganella sp.]
MDYSRVVFENADEPPAGTATSAFVGLCARGKELVFRLPIGYPGAGVIHGYEAARDLHIAFFKLFCRFRSVVRRQRDRLKPDAPTHEDGGPALQNGRQWLTCHDEGDVYYYRHFDAFDALLDAFDELAIRGLERRLRLTDCGPANLMHFQRSDAGRIYQDDDSFYDDASVQPRSTVTLLSADLVGLYCFLLRDLREHVWPADDPAPLQEDILVFAERFEERHLWPRASCWEADQWQQTRDALREKLELIDRMTALKDEDYDALFLAVERFLYPPTDHPEQAGQLWGIDGFWPVWEWLVLTRLATDPVFRQRLLWVETGNLDPHTIGDLDTRGYAHPGGDPAILSVGDGPWETFLRNGKAVGHPYPDAILDPPKFHYTTNNFYNKQYQWINSLTLQEGQVSISLTGMSDHLVVPKTMPGVAHLRSKPLKTVLPVDQQLELAPVVTTTGVGATTLDRPETVALLHRVGARSAGPDAVWRCKPFTSLTDAKRRHMHGALLVDAKYKQPGRDGAAWSYDHRKQGSYEDMLTISCPDRPAAYSIYICPGPPVTAASWALLCAQLEHFDRHFDAGWNALLEVQTNLGSFKNRGQRLVVLGKSIIIIKGGGQQEHARGALLEQLFGHDPRVELAKNAHACSLLGVERFPGNDSFFVKHWPVRDLIDWVLAMP